MAARSINYDQAVQELENLTLELVCDDQVAESAAYQAATLTAANSGRRAFLGGVRVVVPKATPLLLPWPGQTTLNGALAEFATVEDAFRGSAVHTVYFGFSPSESPEHSLAAFCSGWRAGVSPAGAPSDFETSSEGDFALGGVCAGGLAVHRGFLRATGISHFACTENAGISLWKPGADWASATSDGPMLQALPDSLWILGLGHLGQAYLWTLGLLPFASPSDVELMLQDFDCFDDSNVGSGLICSPKDSGRMKARVCAEWLHDRGFRTKICERKFDETVRREPDEPSIALCGFDRPEPRSLLENAGFFRAIECGLGGTINDFDLIHVHAFPGSARARDVWPNTASAQSRPNSKLAAALARPGETCGALALETAGRSVSTSFVGAMASSVVFAELLRPFSRAQHHDELFISPRNFRDCDFRPAQFRFSASEIGTWGYSDVVQTHLAKRRQATEI